MKIQIMPDTRFGNGKILAETLKAEIPDHLVEIADVKEVSPESVASFAPDALIMGGAIRMFRGDPKAKKWLKKLNKALKKSDHKIQFGAGFLTHGLPTKNVQGFARRFLKKLKKASMIEKTYSELLTARVETQEGPIHEEEMEKARKYAKKFLDWMK